GLPRARPMIALHDVTKTFGDRVAVDHVSLVVAPRTTEILLGSSGSGKSTVLRLVLGLLFPDSGEITVDGLPVTVATRDDVLRRIGYVVQEGALYPHLTAAANVTLPARADGWAPSRIADRLAGLTDVVGLEPS